MHKNRMVIRRGVFRGDQKPVEYELHVHLMELIYAEVAILEEVKQTTSTSRIGLGKGFCTLRHSSEASFKK